MDRPDDDPGRILDRLSRAAGDLMDILNAAEAKGIRAGLAFGDPVPLAEALGMELTEIEARLEEVRSASSALIPLLTESFGGSNPPLSV